MWCEPGNVLHTHLLPEELYFEGELLEQRMALVDQLLKSRDISTGGCKLGKGMVVHPFKVFCDIGVISVKQFELEIGRIRRNRSCDHFSLQQPRSSP